MTLAKRRLIAGTAGAISGIVAMIAGYFLFFAKQIGEFAQAHETSRVGSVLLIVGLIIGFIVYSVVISRLER